MVSSGSSNLPIDIHCSKLLDWLLSRRHCNKEWQTSSLKVREKISKAIQDMPEHPSVTEMLAGTYITYSHCQKIVDVLKQTEASTRNVFGRYSSQRMKDWQEVCQMYEKENLYLAEMAQLLQQYVQYEIPSYKKQITKCQQTEQECERKELEYEKLAKEAERQYELECRQLHLLMDEKSAAASSVRVALLQSAENLPDKFTEIGERMKSDLSENLQYYIDFRSASGYDSGQQNRLLPMLLFVLDKGLTSTVYEYKNDSLPSSVERVSLLNLIEKEEKELAKEEIDFDIGIDDGGGIDFGIEAVGSGELVGEQNVAATETERVARGDEALFIFEHRPSMQKLISDLRELQAFYKIRHIELRREESGQDVVGTLLAAAAKDDPLDRLKHSKSNLAALEAILHQLDETLKSLDDSNLRSLAKIRASPEYLQSVADKVTEPRRRSEKFKQSAKLMKEQQEEVRKQAVESQKLSSILGIRAKELQKFLEEDISKRYSNRPVKIVGSTIAL